MVAVVPVLDLVAVIRSERFQRRGAHELTYRPFSEYVLGSAIRQVPHGRRSTRCCTSAPDSTALIRSGDDASFPLPRCAAPRE